ncbi:helix-turn-helix domain-containing protein [Mesorhizobium sp. M4A.F.Ca.ET.020.02.1.1]|uniref:helix-turn-helix domain-containing protein n=1 Tax=Mesorhizobium sp. M4A.F.Ca.ET.020.02.1.1 TaxID=2496652 RepID=UPI000FD6004E|nr:helix-turn-helix domain-containing protein [Mesorhizobium sp. M4A.F.Ca.ET.020.02.1.1]RVD44634.1 helix-turn-helix domain-containing protein [Mesorhizobium sp. M4A.F.Ca.ET.020.02.1.1]
MLNQNRREDRLSACVCCGFDPELKDPEAIARAARLSSFEHRLFEIFRRRFGRYVEADQIAYLLYADDPNGGPLFAKEVIGVTVGRLRKKLKPYGLTIDGMMGRGSSGRRLIWIEAKQAA